MTGHPRSVHVSVSPPSGITVTPGGGTIHVPPSGKGYLTLTVHADSATPETSYAVPVKLTTGGTTLPTTLPGQTLTVLVAQQGSPPAAFNNPVSPMTPDVTAAGFYTDRNSC